MKMPAPMMPPITAMVVPNRPRWRARPLVGEDEALGIAGQGSVTRRCSAHLRQFVKIFNVRERGAVHALHFRIAGLDDVILIGRVRAVAMAEPKMASGQAQRLARENVTGPGTGQARQKHGVDAIPL